jgi:microcystin-dependent protein
MANLTDKLRKVASEGTLTNLAAPGKAIGATSISIASAAGWPTDTGIIVAIRQVDSTGVEVPGTYTEWKATLSGTLLSFGTSPSPVEGTDQVYPAGSSTQVYIPLSSTLWNDLIDALLVSLNQDGTPLTQFVPSGAVSAYAGLSAPTGYLLCDGSAVSRTTYATLFGVIGTTYGTGNGTTTFNLPDLQGRVPVGKGTNTDVSTLGNNDGVTVANRRPKHRHTVNDPTHTHSFNGPIGVINNKNYSGSGFNPFDADAGGFALNAAATGISVGPSGGTDALDSQPYQVVNYIIKT